MCGLTLLRRNTPIGNSTNARCVKKAGVWRLSRQAFQSAISWPITGDFRCYHAKHTAKTADGPAFLMTWRMDYLEMRESVTHHAPTFMLS